MFITNPHVLTLQNKMGLLKEKNKHLLEVARAIMFSMNIPKYFWGDAVLTASYLINRMPTRVLQYTYPLNCFQKKKKNSHIKALYRPTIKNFWLHRICTPT